MNKNFEILRSTVEACLTSFHTFFTVANKEGLVIRPCQNQEALEIYYHALVALKRELAVLGDSGNVPPRHKVVTVPPQGCPECDSIDYYNQLYDLVGENPSSHPVSSSAMIERQRS